MEETEQVSREQKSEDWKEVVRRGGFPEVDLVDGKHGWASPPGSSFLVRGVNYFHKRLKSPAGDWLLQPLGVDWLKANARLDHVLAHPENRVMEALKRAHADGEALKSFILAINLQVPGKEHHSAVFYFVADAPIPEESLLFRFMNEDDAFRNSRFKIVNRVVRGPWIVRAAVGNHAACLLGRALTCRYMKGPNYLEIDVDIGSSTVANAILHLALGYATLVTVDMAFLVESQSDDELPENIMGAVRIAQIQMEAARFLEVQNEDVHVANHIPGSLQSCLSWRKFGRSLSMLGHVGKAGKIEAEDKKI